MTFICAPVRQFCAKKCLVYPQVVSLFEVNEGGQKVIYNREGKVQYIDIDWMQPYPETSIPVIVSYHNFQETPDLDKVLHRIRGRHPRAHFYKIATHAQSVLDSLRLLLFLKRERNIIGLCMGELGKITRIFAPIFGIPFTYALLKEEDRTAEGQLLISELLSIYHFDQLNSKTRLFGLVGYPVLKSVGHLFHNAYFRDHRLNAVYVKMAVKEDEVAEFFRLAESLSFEGLSVTAPLKERVLPFLKEVDSEAALIGSVNTLVRGKGYNTDLAFIDELTFLEDKPRVVVLGSGGVSRTMLYALMKKKIRGILWSRSKSKGELLADYFGCEWRDKIPPYEVLINATSSSMPISSEELLPKAWVIDFSIVTTPFLKEAMRKGCRCIDGLYIYFSQAIAQQELWRSIF